jgi:hypothetical protein
VKIGGFFHRENFWPFGSFGGVNKKFVHKSLKIKKLYIGIPKPKINMQDYVLQIAILITKRFMTTAVKGF